MKEIRVAEDLHDDCNAKRIGAAQRAAFSFGDSASSGRESADLLQRSRSLVGTISESITFLQQ